VDARRYPAYVKKYGTRYKWELDALEPAVLVALVQGAIDDVIDMPLWLEATAEDESERDRLRAIAERWDDVTLHGGRKLTVTRGRVTAPAKPKEIEPYELAKLRGIADGLSRTRRVRTLEELHEFW